MTWRTPEQESSQYINETCLYFRKIKYTISSQAEGTTEVFPTMQKAALGSSLRYNLPKVPNNP